jgi:hypothetical protein
VIRRASISPSSPLAAGRWRGDQSSDGGDDQDSDHPGEGDVLDRGGASAGAHRVTLAPAASPGACTSAESVTGL